jgi:NADH:ubiquinone oxidoreductase subunit E
VTHPVIPIAVQGASRERKRQAPKGRRVDPVALAEVQALLGSSARRSDLLIEHLHLIQDRYGHLSTAHLAALAAEMRLAQAEVFEVASFYHHFDIVREGEAAPAALTVRVCGGLSCELAGARELLERLPALLGRDVRVLAAPCIGRCEQAPAALVAHHAIPHATIPTIVQFVSTLGSGTNVDTVSTMPAPELVSTLVPDPKVDTDWAVAEHDYSLLQACHAGERVVEAVIGELEHSGLRGLGGAGFPTGRKWRIVRSEPGPRLMAVNIDEGEPGTFKDRYYLERDPQRFIEGMLIAAWATGIDEIYIYLRDEYHDCRRLLAGELQKLRANPPVPQLPVIHLRRGAGAYICGEESAMIESIEGKRGMPRLRPPYVAQVGLFGRPTLEHNFETLYWVRDILEKGADWFASQGRNGRKGLRSFSVSGRVKQPGVKLAPAGITIRELIAEYCGGMLDGHQLLCLSARRRFRRHPSGLDGRHSAGLRYAAALWLLYRFRRHHGAVGSGHRRRSSAQYDELLPRRILRPVHAVPGGHGQGGGPDRAAGLGCRAAGRAVAGDARCLHLRAGAGRPESSGLRAALFPARGERMSRSNSHHDECNAFRTEWKSG